MKAVSCRYFIIIAKTVFNARLTVEKLTKTIYQCSYSCYSLHTSIYIALNKDTKLSQGQGRPLREVLIVYFKIIRSFTQAPTFSSAIVLISRDFIPNIIRTLQNTNKSKCVSLIEFWSFMVQYNCNKYIVNKSKDGNRFCQLIQSQFRKQLLL